MNKFYQFTQTKLGLISIGLIAGFLLSWMLFGGGDAREPSGAGEETAGVTTWTCSMDPQIKQPNPGDCPICGMDLIPLTDDSGDDDNPRQLSMSTAAMKLAEIQTTSVVRDFADHELRLVGKVDYDETRLRYLTARYPGRLDRLFVDYTGTPVRTGDHLVEIYSPNIISDQEALIQATKAISNLQGSSVAQVLNSKQSLLEKARERLRLLGLTQKQIQEIETQGQPAERITFYSPIDGIVIHKNVSEGDYVQTGDRIYTIADLSQVWVRMDAYESDLQYLHIGQEVEFSSVAYPGEQFTGRIVFIDPFLNEQTRTVKVRVNVPNPHGKLKPDMFIHATVRARVNETGRVFDLDLAGKWISPMHPEIVKDEPGTCDVCGMPLVSAESLGYVNPAEADSIAPLLIPDSAPLITGKRAVVYVKLPNTERPTFEGREVVLGPKVGKQYVVKEGLAEGEAVVTKGNFKIDSALQIQAKPSMMSPDDEAVESGTEPFDVERLVPQNVLGDLLEPYRTFWTALAGDDLETAQSATHDWVAVAKQHELDDIEKLGHEIMHAADLDEARIAFYQISQIIIASVKVQGSPKDVLSIAYCPMAFENQGAEWLQWQEEILNPYFGAAMLKCGSIEEQLQPNEAGGTETSSDLLLTEEAFHDLLPHYLEIQSALAADDLAAAQTAAAQIDKGSSGDESNKIAEFIESFRHASDMADARLAFSVLSNILIQAIKRYGANEIPVNLAYCPMAFQNQGAEWLQTDPEINNPYFGASMLKCGEIQETYSP